MHGCGDMALLPLALVGVGTAVSVAGQLSAAAQQAKAAQLNAQMTANENEARAQLSDREAVIAARESAQEALAIERDVETRRLEFSRLQGEQRAAIGASGIEFQGTPLLILAETAREAELDVQSMRQASEQRQLALRDQAALREFEAGELRRGAVNAKRVGKFEAGSIRQAGAFRALSTGISGVSSATNILLR